MFLASKTVWLCRKYFYASGTVKAQHLWGEKERERPEIEESPRWPESPSPARVTLPVAETSSRDAPHSARKGASGACGSQHARVSKADYAHLSLTLPIWKLRDLPPAAYKSATVRVFIPWKAETSSSSLESQL